MLILLMVLSFLLCGCTEIKVTHPLGKDILLEINDISCSMGTGILRILEAREEYKGTAGEVLWIRTIGETTMAEYVKNTVKDDLLRYTAAQVMARNLTVFLTDEEQEQAESDAAGLLMELNGIYDLDQYDITTADAVDLFVKRTYYNKVYEKLSENIFMEISEADTKVIQLDYVFIPAEDGIETAERMRNEMKGGADFYEVCLDYGYEPVLNEKTTRGSQSAAFENIAFALRDNEISEIVETRSGYYIIDCLEDYMVAESIANKNRIISDEKRERFQEAYEKFASASTMRFNSGEWDLIDISTME